MTVEQINQKILDNRCGFEWELSQGGRNNPHKYGMKFCSMLRREVVLYHLLAVESA